MNRDDQISFFHTRPYYFCNTQKWLIKKKKCIGHIFTHTWDTFNIAWQNIEHMQEEKVGLPNTMS
jgi:hypothetical protein